MRRILILFACILLATAAAAKPHVINFGTWMPVKLFLGPDETKNVEMKVRPLRVDGAVKEFTTGEPYDVTDRVFVVRKAYRLNDTLPEDGKTAPRWKWQRGGWLMVDRNTGRVSQVTLPLFDPFYSEVSWYRDYAAYCGLSDAGDKVLAMIVQLGVRKPVLRRELHAANGGDTPDSECGTPKWERQPMRVTFSPKGAQPVTFAVRGHAADIDTTADDQP